MEGLDEGNEQCMPIDTYEEVLNYMDNPPQWAAYCEPLALDMQPQTILKNSELYSIEDDNRKYFCHLKTEKINFYSSQTQPKTLVCHDMANNYHEDSYILGADNHEAYSFYDWAVVDVFCYFSHHFITIPPLSWINVGHRHGVKVIGTIITEWTAGFNIWKKILSSKESYEEFANCLVAIAKHFKFEGWLLNIENPIENPRQLIDFVKYFHRTLHAEVDGAFLIWYDSVTTDGKLSWQNGLNYQNYEFFNSCDGIFTNYSWVEADIESSAKMAGARRLDVFVGLDVWGRHFHGGGKFNTSQALQLVHKHNCSAAIFGQAWTHEAVEDQEVEDINSAIHNGADQITRYDLYLLRDRAMWGEMWPFLFTKPLTALPLKVSFCRGQGKMKWSLGKISQLEPWFNYAEMEIQPNSLHGQHGYRLKPLQRVTKLKENNFLDHIQKDEQVEPPANSSLYNPNELAKEEPPKPPTETKDRYKVVEYKLHYVPTEKHCLEYYNDDAFNGGSCLLVNPNDSSTSRDPRLIRIFHTSFNLTEKLIIYVVTKTLDEVPSQFLNIIVTLQQSMNADDKFNVVLWGRDDNEIITKSSGIVNVVNFPLISKSAELLEIEDFMAQEYPDMLVKSGQHNGWQVRYYLLDYVGFWMTAIKCQPGFGQGGILLGQLAICPLTQSLSFENEVK